MAHMQYLVFNNENIPMPASYSVSLSDVEADSGGMTEAGTTQRDVVREGVVQIAVTFRVSKKWLNKFSAYKKLASIIVGYLDTETMNIVNNAKKCADQNPGYKVFDADGNVVYEPKAAEPAVKVPFLVKVSISNLNIRKGPGTGYDRVQFCPVGVYTIVEVKFGAGSKAGWGRLKSGIGWISLDYVKRL